MLDNQKQINVITAGNTGLIGNELTKQLLDSENLAHLYVLSRAQLIFSPQITGIVSLNYMLKMG